MPPQPNINNLQGPAHAGPFCVRRVSEIALSLFQTSSPIRVDLVLSHAGVGDGKQQSLLDTGPDLIDIDTAGDIVVGGLPPDL